MGDGHGSKLASLAHEGDPSAFEIDLIGAQVHQFGRAQVAPRSAAEFRSANSELEAYPLRITPALGTLVGKGLFVSQLAYTATDTARQVLLQRFRGLITSASFVLKKHHTRDLPAWEAELWSGNAPRIRILAAWGHRANIVLTDGVEYGRVIEAVIGLNAQ